jgi:hypothetical protein
MRRLKDMIGNGRLWRGLLGVSALALLSGCGWLGFGSGSPDSQKARPGADRKVTASGALPSANPGQQHEAGVIAADPTGTAQIGSIVPAKGGQKAQKEAIEKEANERDAKEREAREKREAEERAAKAKEPKEEAKPLPPAGTLPSKPAAAERGNPENAEPGATTAPAPVTKAPVAPPPATEPPAGSPKT